MTMNAIQISILGRWRCWSRWRSLFDFMNGFHDAANSIATVVSTGVLKPQQAVVLAAFFNFVAIFVFHLNVAATVGKGIVDPAVVDHYVVFGALVGAIVWNVDHLVLRHSVVLVARADRRPGRRGGGQGRHRRADRRRHLQDRALHLRSRRCSASCSARS